jgi:hypothetical protein
LTAASSLVAKNRLLSPDATALRLVLGNTTAPHASVAFQNVVRACAVVAGASTLGLWAAPGMQERWPPRRAAMSSCSVGGQALSSSPYSTNTGMLRLARSSVLSLAVSRWLAMVTRAVGLLARMRSSRKATIGAGTRSAIACGSRTRCQISAIFPLRSCGAAPSRNFSIELSSSARGPVRADGPELIRVSEARVQPPITASRATRPPKE